MQDYWIGTGEEAKFIRLPLPEEEVVPGIAWGRGDMVDTPAYWVLRCSADENPLHGFLSNSGSLVEEIAFCLLGGFGITAEMNGAVFERLKLQGMFELENSFTVEHIKQLLLKPVVVGNRERRYRFPNQRAERLHIMRNILSEATISDWSRDQAIELLKQIPGIGPKTAAWVIRNHFDCDKVAILDVHVIRACKNLRLFPRDVRLPKDYSLLEAAFINFANAIEIRPAILDAVMWTEMRSNKSRY